MRTLTASAPQEYREHLDHRGSPAIQAIPAPEGQAVQAGPEVRAGLGAPAGPAAVAAAVAVADEGASRFEHRVIPPRFGASPDLSGASLDAV